MSTINNSNFVSALQVLIALMNEPSFKDIVNAIPVKDYGYKGVNGDEYRKWVTVYSCEKYSISVELFCGYSCEEPYSCINYTLVPADGSMDSGTRSLCHTGTSFRKTTDPVKKAKNDKYATVVAGMILSYLEDNGLATELSA